MFFLKGISNIQQEGFGMLWAVCIGLLLGGMLWNALEMPSLPFSFVLPVPTRPKA